MTFTQFDSRLTTIIREAQDHTHSRARITRFMALDWDSNQAHGITEACVVFVLPSCWNNDRCCYCWWDIFCSMDAYMPFDEYSKCWTNFFTHFTTTTFGMWIKCNYALSALVSLISNNKTAIRANPCTVATAITSIFKDHQSFHHSSYAHLYICKPNHVRNKCGSLKNVWLL